MTRQRSHIGQPEQSEASIVRFWCGRSASPLEADLVGSTARRAPTCSDCIAAFTFASGGD